MPPFHRQGTNLARIRQQAGNLAVRVAWSQQTWDPVDWKPVITLIDQFVNQLMMMRIIVHQLINQVVNQADESMGYMNVLLYITALIF